MKSTTLWNQLWTPENWQRAQEMAQDGCGHDTIAKALGLTEAQVRNKFWNEHYRHKSAERKGRPTEAQFADRDQRSQASAGRTRTQEFFGDPPPGFSALDEKRRQAGAS